MKYNIKKTWWDDIRKNQKELALLEQEEKKIQTIDNRLQTIYRLSNEADELLRKGEEEAVWFKEDMLDKENFTLTLMFGQEGISQNIADEYRTLHFNENKSNEEKNRANEILEAEFTSYVERYLARKTKRNNLLAKIANLKQFIASLTEKRTGIMQCIQENKALKSKLLNKIYYEWSYNIPPLVRAKNNLDAFEKNNKRINLEDIDSTTQTLASLANIKKQNTIYKRNYKSLSQKLEKYKEIGRYMYFNEEVCIVDEYSEYADTIAKLHYELQRIGYVQTKQESHTAVILIKDNIIKVHYGSYDTYRYTIRFTKTNSLESFINGLVIETYYFSRTRHGYGQQFQGKKWLVEQMLECLKNALVNVTIQ